MNDFGEIEQKRDFLERGISSFMALCLTAIKLLQGGMAQINYFAYDNCAKLRENNLLK